MLHFRLLISSCFLISLFSVNSYGQRQGDIWCFGDSIQMNFDPNEFKKEGDEFYYQYLLNSKQLPAGLYLLEVTYGGERKLMKLIIK